MVRNGCGTKVGGGRWRAAPWRLGLFRVLLASAPHPPPHPSPHPPPSLRLRCLGHHVSHIQALRNCVAFVLLVRSKPTPYPHVSAEDKVASFVYRLATGATFAMCGQQFSMCTAHAAESHHRVAALFCELYVLHRLVLRAYGWVPSQLTHAERHHPPHRCELHARYSNEIRLPSAREIATSREKFAARKGMKDCVCAIDGTHIKFR